MMGRDRLVEQLRDLGLEGRVVMVHASLRAVGPIEGGGDALIAAIVETLGPAGTMLMVLDAIPDRPFDALRSPVDIDDMGVLAELFRCTEGVRVNDHVAARFAALGADAEYLLDPTPLHDYLGPGSVLERLVEKRGLVLRLGADIDTTTLTHHAEYLAAVPNKRRVRRRLVRADVGEVWVESLDDTDGIVHWDGGDYFGQILRDFLDAGHATTGPVGRCRAEVLDARRFTALAVAWLEARFG